MVIALLLALSALTITFDPSHAPLALIALFGVSIHSLIDAWRAISGTALRPALVWAALAFALGLCAQAIALAEPLAGGRPIAQRVTYLCVLTLLASLGSVLNARTPGGKAWALLMSLLVVVFLIPWLEDQTRLRRAVSLPPLHLDAPWSMFYGVLVAVAVTNYLPTRYGWAAAVGGVVFVLEYLALMPPHWLDSRRALIALWVAWTMALGLALARASVRRTSHATSNCERLWFWFRDNWGVVWALRVLERFNRAAEVSRWPVRLTWFGIVPFAEGSPDQRQPAPEDLELVFRNLMKRFAESWCLDQVVRTASLRSGEATQGDGETAANSSASSNS